jgi:hypothetical protein
MASVFAIYSVGESIADYLSKTFPAELSAQHGCQFRSVSSAELNKDDEFSTTTVSLYLYRVTVNEQLRNASRSIGSNDSDIPLSIDLHYLLTVWAADHLTEHLVLAWAMSQLYRRQVLTASDLSPDGGWGPGDVIQLLPEELPVTDMMRIWDALAPKYRTSASYVARAVRLDVERDEKPGRAVVARRDAYQKVEAGT